MRAIGTDAAEEVGPLRLLGAGEAGMYLCFHRIFK